MKKNIKPKNDKGQRHGYWEVYFDNGELWYKCVYINGVINGFEGFYNYVGILRRKNYYL